MVCFPCKTTYPIQNAMTHVMCSGSICMGQCTSADPPSGHLALVNGCCYHGWKLIQKISTFKRHLTYSSQRLGDTLWCLHLLSMYGCFLDQASVNETSARRPSWDHCKRPNLTLETLVRIKLRSTVWPRHTNADMKPWITHKFPECEQRVKYKRHYNCYYKMIKINPVSAETVAEPQATKPKIYLPRTLC